MALISLSFKKIYKPTNNNLRTSSNTSRANQDNSLRINRSVGYENQRIGNVVGAREIVEQVDWRDDTDDDELEDQELEAHYMYMAQLQEEMVADLRYFNSLELEVDSLKSQLETQKTQFLNDIDRLSKEYYYADHMNAILGVYTELDEVTNLQIVLFIVDSGCSKHMTGNLKLLINFVKKFLGTVKFGNDQIAPILRYGDLVQGVVTIKRVYYAERLNHNLFFIGQFYDADLEVAFRKSTCFIRDLKGNDLLTGSRGTDLYSITLQDTKCPNPICLMAKATSSQAWLRHRRLSHLNFYTINLLSKNDIVVGLLKLKFVKDHLCSSLIVDDYSRYTWTPFWRSKDETPDVLIDFLRLVQRGLKAQVRVVRTDKGTEFLNQTLHGYFATEGIHHQTSVARTPEQNGVVERRNRTLVEVARTMLSVAKVPLFFWAEVVSKSSVICSADAPNQCQHHTTPLNNHTTHVPTCQLPSLAPTVSSSENINQAETYAENDQVTDDEFINIFCTLVHDQGETSSRHVDSLNMKNFTSLND
nr:hypothetical protein [Tanacetum cinerariifolium]GEZ70352.1 hypothetical protein [Tanacetum cinerariifolium]